MTLEHPKFAGVATPCIFKTGIVALLLSLVCASCVPLPYRTVTNVIAQRADVNGAPSERLEQEIVFHRRFYLIGPHGPFVTLQWPKKFNYRLVNPQERRQNLPFLVKTEVQADYLIAFPISDARWIAITLPQANGQDAPHSGDLAVFVFQTNRLQFSKIVASCFSDYPRGPWPGSRGWKPLSGKTDYEANGFRFDAANERVTFKTADGNFLFDPTDGTLLKL